MLTLLLWLFVKIPLILVSLAAALYLLYIKKTYQVVEAECLSSIKQEKEKNYLIRYSYMSCENNVIEQVDKMIESNSPQEKGEMCKLFVRPNQYKAKRYDKVVYGTWSIIFIAMILVISL